jgi:hypothetical protein
MDSAQVTVDPFEVSIEDFDATMRAVFTRVLLDSIEYAQRTDRALWDLRELSYELCRFARMMSEADPVSVSVTTGIALQQTLSALVHLEVCSHRDASKLLKRFVKCVHYHRGRTAGLMQQGFFRSKPFIRAYRTGEIYPIPEECHSPSPLVREVFTSLSVTMWYRDDGSWESMADALASIELIDQQWRFFHEHSFVVEDMQNLHALLSEVTTSGYATAGDVVSASSWLLQGNQNVHGLVPLDPWMDAFDRDVARAVKVISFANRRGMFGTVDSTELFALVQDLDLPESLIAFMVVDESPLPVDGGELVHPRFGLISELSGMEEYYRRGVHLVPWKH